MRHRFNINGDLWNDMLNRTALLSYDYSLKSKTWTAFTRSYRDADPYPFTVYKMDSEGIFHIVEQWPRHEREPLMFKRYKKNFGIVPEKRPHAVPCPAKLGDPIWFKGMTAKQYEEANGIRPSVTSHTPLADENT